MKKIKTIDLLMASEIFLLAILEFISWRLCVNDNYSGEIKTSFYMIRIYPLLCTIGFLIVATGKAKNEDVKKLKTITEAFLTVNAFVKKLVNASIKPMILLL